MHTESIHIGERDVYKEAFPSYMMIVLFKQNFIFHYISIIAIIIRLDLLKLDII